MFINDKDNENYVYSFIQAVNVDEFKGRSYAWYDYKNASMWLICVCRYHDRS